MSETSQRAPSGDSEDLARIAAAAWQQELERTPFYRLKLGLPVERLPRRTLDEACTNATAAKQRVADLRGVSIGRLSPRERLTHAFLTYMAETESQDEAFWWAQWSVAPYSSMDFSLNVNQVLAPFTFQKAQDGERYWQLITDYLAAVNTAADKLRLQAQRGWRVPRPALVGIRKTWSGYRGLAAAIVPAIERLAALPQADSLHSRIAAFVEDQIVPAFDEVLAVLGPDYEALAPAETGICNQPGGEEAYGRLLRMQLTFSSDAKTVHELGLEQVRLLQARMEEVRRESFRFGDTEEAFHAKLRSDPRCHAREAGDVEATYRRHIGRITPLLPHWFVRLPQAPHNVQRLAPELEPGMSYGHYDPPSGTYRYNGSNLDTRMQINAAPLIFHELVPGHHFHLARQAENVDLPAIRRHSISFTCFNEGWAEYSAGLAEEMGLYDDPYDLYGWLGHQRFVAQRLVVDTGMNALGWTLRQAQDFMRTNTLESETQIASETLRYSVDLPAQALAYRMGFLKIRELRKRARERLGNQFDIRRFHEAILDEGALPLAVLEQSIDAWSERETG